MKQTSEAAFETAIESVLLADGYHKLPSAAFERERAIFPDEILEFIRSTQAKQWEKLQSLHGEECGKRVLEAPAHRNEWIGGGIRQGNHHVFWLAFGYFTQPTSICPSVHVRQCGA